jgi:ornithine cyclodeaminase/alanine dehydrogenase-like protein (mu-crystallin family)
VPDITILTERELRDCVALDADAIACIEACFRTLATEQVVMPPILRLDISEHHGEVDVKTAYLPGMPSFAIKPAKAKTFAETVGAELDLAIGVASSPEELVRQSDIVVTATPSTAPLIQAGWLQAGQHVTAMGSDAEHKTELAPGVVVRSRYVCDRQSQCATLDELHHAISAGAVPPDARFPELGQVIAGQVAGRTSDREITVCDLTGTGAQDTAIATLAAERARARGAGTAFRT